VILRNSPFAKIFDKVHVVLQATGHVTKFQVRKGERESKGEFGYNRDFKKPRRQCGGQRRLKNEFIFYLQIL